jgi:hypothetical protein
MDDLATAMHPCAYLLTAYLLFSLQMESHGIGLNDGLLARLLKSSAWKTHRISDACLLSHSPSPQLCALHDGVWDDSVYSLIQHSGGRCLDKEEAENVLFNGGHDLEMVEVSVSHDGSSESVLYQYLLWIYESIHYVAVRLVCTAMRPDSLWQDLFHTLECFCTQHSDSSKGSQSSFNALGKFCRLAQPGSTNSTPNSVQH